MLCAACAVDTGGGCTGRAGRARPDLYARKSRPAAAATPPRLYPGSDFGAPASGSRVRDVSHDLGCVGVRQKCGTPPVLHNKTSGYNDDLLTRKVL
ncbi:unnamed protein product, partial [Iphiclides podalirius]